MGLIELLLLAVGLAMDAFAVSICKGLAAGKVTKKEFLLCGVWFGFFQGMMPFIGYLVGSRFEKLITMVAPWVAFGLLSLIGGNMIKEALSSDEETSLGFDVKTMFMMAIATSIDALAVGITFVAVPVKVFNTSRILNVLFAVIVIGVVTFIISMIGVKIGSIFGDAPAALYNYFTGASVTMKQLLPWPTLDPQKDALLLMVVSIAFGLVHILIGMGCKFIVCAKQKDWGGAFFDTGLWMLLLVGIAVLAVGMFTIPVLTTVGAVIAIGCAVGLVLTQGRSKKGIVGKAIGGLASLYDITSYISDLLSYSRLLALGLTTGVMAQVFNMLSTMMGKSVVGFIFMLVIFIVGHLVNIGLNALGSYVHTMRLQYVEMFGKFYEGGGNEFQPFSLQSKYIKIQEDK